MSQLSPEIIKRIKADALQHWLNTKGDQGELDYIAGATATALRYQSAVDALEKILAGRICDNAGDRLSDTQMARIAQETLNNLK